MQEGVDPDPVVVEFRSKDEPQFQKPDHDPHGEVPAAAAHSTTSCDRCGKIGFVPTHACEAAAGFLDDRGERELLCSECGSD